MSFDPYCDWLGIPPDRRPPTYYDLLGLPEGETDEKRIREAAAERYERVREYTLAGPLAEHANRILEEISRALDCLIHPGQREEYLRGLKGSASAQSSAARRHAETSGLEPLPPLPVAKDVFEQAARQPAADGRRIPRRYTAEPSASVIEKAVAAVRESELLRRDYIVGPAIAMLLFAALLMVWAASHSNGPPVASHDGREMSEGASAEETSPKESESTDADDAGQRPLETPVSFPPEFPEPRDTPDTGRLPNVAAPRRTSTERDDSAAATSGEERDDTVFPDVRPHQRAVRALAFSHDGSLLASGSSDQTVNLRDAGTGEIQRTIPAGYRIRCLDFHPNGSLLAVGGMGETVTLWDTATGQVRRVLHHGTRNACSVGFNRDGSLVACGAGDGTLTLWDVVTGERRWVLDAHEREVLALAFRPSGATLTSASADGNARSWRVATGSLQRALYRYVFLGSVAFSSDGSLLAVGNSAGRVHVWSRAGQQTLDGHGLDVPSIAFSPDGTMLACRVFCELAPEGGSRSPSAGDAIQLWDLEAEQLLGTLPREVGAPRVVSLAFRPDGSQLAAGNDDGTVSFTRISAIIASPDQPTVASAARPGSADGSVVGDDVRRADDASRAAGSFPGQPTEAREAPADVDARLQLTLQNPRPTSLATQRASVVFSPDGEYVVAVSPDGVMDLWDTENGNHRTSRHVNCCHFDRHGRLLAVSTAKQVQLLYLRNLIMRKPSQQLYDHQSRVRCVALSPKAASLASADEVGVVKLWDMRERGTPTMLRASSDPILCLAFSPDESLLASGGVSPPTTRWDEMAIVKTWEAAYSRWSICVSADMQLRDPTTGKLRSLDAGDEIAALEPREGTVRIWDLPSRRCRHALPAPGSVESVAFRPDGAILAIAVSDHTIKLWDVAAAQLRGTLEGHEAGVRSVAFRPDGAILASGSRDGTVRFWDPATGELRGTIPVDSIGVDAVTFNADSSLFASASHDGTVRLWEVEVSATSNPP